MIIYKTFYFIVADNKLEDDNSVQHILDYTVRVSLDLEKTNIRVNFENEQLQKEKSMNFFKRLFLDVGSFLNTTKRWRIYEVPSTIEKVDYESPVYVHKQTLELTQNHPSPKETNNYIRFSLIRWYEDGLSSI